MFFRWKKSTAKVKQAVCTIDIYTITSSTRPKMDLLLRIMQNRLAVVIGDGSTWRSALSKVAEKVAGSG
jgi:hypothetical protein